MSTIKETILLAWTEGSDSIQPNYFKATPVHYPSNGLPFLYGGLIKSAIGPGSDRMLLLKVPRALALRSGLRKVFSNLDVAPLHNATDPLAAWLGLTLTNPELSEIFLFLTVDLVTRIGKLDTNSSRIEEFNSRINIWQKLFESTLKDGLSLPARIGLFGELSFILKLVDLGLNVNAIIGAWTGLNGGVHDFRFDSLSMEVKTTVGNGDQIRIHNEDQLDLSKLKVLFLIIIYLSESKTNGVSLPSIVDKFRSLFACNAGVLESFNNKLLSSGYHDLHAGEYGDALYSERNCIIYHVNGSFPRLEASVMPDGVQNVAYSILTSRLFPYIVDLSETINKFLT